MLVSDMPNTYTLTQILTNATNKSTLIENPRSTIQRYINMIAQHVVIGDRSNFLHTRIQLFIDLRGITTWYIGYVDLPFYNENR